MTTVWPVAPAPRWPRGSPDQAISCSGHSALLQLHRGAVGSEHLSSRFPSDSGGLTHGRSQLCLRDTRGLKATAPL